MSIFVPIYICRCLYLAGWMPCQGQEPFSNPLPGDDGALFEGLLSRWLLDGGKRDKNLTNWWSKKFGKEEKMKNVKKQKKRGGDAAFFEGLLTAHWRKRNKSLTELGQSWQIHICQLTNTCLSVDKYVFVNWQKSIPEICWRVICGERKMIQEIFCTFDFNHLTDFKKIGDSSKESLEDA